MGTRRQVISFLVATSLLAAPVAAMGAHVSGSNTKLASLIYGMMPAAPGYAVEDAHAMTDIVEFSKPDLWDGLELAIPELVDELELVVDEDEYELAVPDFNDGLELAQAKEFWHQRRRA
jgi:hypothetical protein